MFTGNGMADGLRFFSAGYVTAYTLAALLAFASVCPGETGRIGFSALADGYWQIWTMEMHGKNCRQLTRSLRDKKEPVWIDGERLIYRTANAAFFIADIKTGEESALLKPYGKVFDPAISTDGCCLLFTRFRVEMTDNADIWRFGFSDNRLKKLTDIPGLQYDPAWSPDGKTIAYVSSGKEGVHNIWVMDENGGNHTVLTDNNALNLQPEFSPDGKKIVFASNASGNYDIWIMDAGGRNPKPLTRNEGLDVQPAWSPDGKNILFVSNRSGNTGIWIMNADGSDMKPVTPKGLRCSDPSWLTGTSPANPKK